MNFLLLKTDKKSDIRLSSFSHAYFMVGFQSLSLTNINYTVQHIFFENYKDSDLFKTHV